MKKAIITRVRLLAYFLIFGLPAALAFVFLPLGILLFPVWAERTGRAMLDEGVNAAYFAGSPRQSLSAHAGDTFISGAPTWWAMIVKAITDRFEVGHVLKAAMQEPLGPIA